MSKGITLKDDGTRQWSLFDGANPLKVTKPLRLIELFAGIGAQAKALENLGVKFEHYRICEFDKYAVASYNAVHGTDFTTSDITKIHAADLGIVETDKYEYIMTYSFPCTDLSKAGKQQGMSRESGTRSGLLWEVERLLKKAKELPQILLMENVPDVISEKNSADFFAWCRFLEDLGYTNKYAILNAKDFGVPQNRERCFMLSWLGDFHYDFPQAKPLTVRLKDFLEPDVDKKYYLSYETVKSLNLGDNICGGIYGIYRKQFERADAEASIGIVGILLSNQGKRFEKETDVASAILARDYKGFGNQTTNGVLVMKSGKQEPIAYDEQNRKIRNDGLIGTLTTDGSSPKHNNRVIETIVYDGFNATVKKDSSCIGTITGNCSKDLKRNGQGIIEMTKQYSRPHGFNKGGVSESDIYPAVRCSSTEDGNNGIIEGIRVRKLTPKECWRLMGFDDESFSRAEKKVSNSQLYKQAGNSIVVDVLMAIFKNLF